MQETVPAIHSIVQGTFLVTAVALGASAFFFFNEKDKVHPRYSLALLLSTLITGIACIMYVYMKDKYVGGTQFPTQIRYFDWILTTPLMMLEYAALLNFKDKIGIIVRLVLWDAIMILCGYLGETLGFQIGGFQIRWVMFVIACGGWLGIMTYLYTGIRNQANLADPETRKAVVLLTKFVTIGWLIYPIGYVVRALAPEYGDWCQLVYNIGDAVNKIGFGAVIWFAGVSAREQSSSSARSEKLVDAQVTS